MMQSKRKSKVHPLAGGWEDSSRNIALGALRTQAFIVVCSDGNVHSYKTGLCDELLQCELDAGDSSLYS
jgi:hypothetical protein